jgi:AcrR family transcriptional regulator
MLSGMPTLTRRASPMAVEDRRAMIIDAIIPLLLEHGASITSRQIAEGAGIAEGTIFRAFGDKESLIHAAVEKYFDPAPLRAKLAEIDPQQPLRAKIMTVIELMQSRFSGMFSMMAAVGGTERPPMPGTSNRLEFATIIAGILEPDLDRLNLPAERVGPVLRLVAFSTAIPAFNETIAFTVDELTDVVLYGIAGHPDDLQTAATGPEDTQSEAAENAAAEHQAAEHQASTQATE